MKHLQRLVVFRSAEFATALTAVVDTQALNRIRRSVLFGCMVIVFASGCHPVRDGYRHYPRGAMSLPTGTMTRQIQAAQIEKAHRDGLVLYEASWIDGSDQLGPAAIERMAIQCNSDCDFVSFVTLEPSQDETLNERRRQTLLDLAYQHGLEISPDAIRFAYPDGNELHGEESVRIASEMMRGQQQGGQQNAFGGGTDGIFGGAISGGSGGFPNYFSGGGR